MTGRVELSDLYPVVSGKPLVLVDITTVHTDHEHVFVGTVHNAPEPAFRVFLPRGAGIEVNTRKFRDWLDQTRFIDCACIGGPTITIRRETAATGEETLRSSYRVSP